MFIRTDLYPVGLRWTGLDFNIFLLQSLDLLPRITFSFEMSNCAACKKVRASSDDFACCDGCGNFLCQSCSSLTSTEMRAVVLKKRRIIFYCDKCIELQQDRHQAVDMDVNPMSGFKEVLDLCISDFREEFKELLSSFKCSLTDDIYSRVDQLSLSITDLKDSNIDMVRLFSGFNSGIVDPPIRNSLPTVRSQSSLATTSENIVFSGANLGTVHDMNTSVSVSDGGSKMDQILPVNVGPPTGLRPATGTKPATGSIEKRVGPVIVGSRKGCKISAAVVPRKRSVFVSRLSLEVDALALEEHLKSTFGPDNFYMVEKQTVRSGDYAGFRVETTVDLADQMLDASKWPEGVAVKKFRFFRPQTNDRARTGGSRQS